MIASYWNNNGKFQAQYDELAKLVPDFGKCDTVAGELFRAANRVGYDFYNNGMGNNTSGALNFLKANSAIDQDVYDHVYEYTRGRLYGGNYNGDTLHYNIERMIDQTVQMITNNPVLITMENNEDMFDYEDQFLSFCEQCECELDDGHRSWLCEDCERYEEENYEDEEEFEW